MGNWPGRFMAKTEFQQNGVYVWRKLISYTNLQREYLITEFDLTNRFIV
jgi:hypothetical protein